MSGIESNIYKFLKKNYSQRVFFKLLGFVGLEKIKGVNNKSIIYIGLKKYLKYFKFNENKIKIEVENLKKKSYNYNIDNIETIDYKIKKGKMPATIRYLRKNYGLSCRGQHTRTNSKTAKRIAVRLNKNKAWGFGLAVNSIVYGDMWRLGSK